ncbi:macro domain-containing protein [Pantoea sp. SJZ147]|uniref:macro domain-containing protein n=1 Tax=Pantoea sp. SJZ147 TaxID=2572896 RepID=UPI0011A51B2C|nr:macro domain-containing protein [Pantoea sp. SJZ147]
MLVDNKSYYRADSEFIKGEGVVYTEFIGEIATRQISILDGSYYSSSSVTDWDQDVGYLLYDGKKSELDLSESETITEEIFEEQWRKGFIDQDEMSYIHSHVGDASVPLKESIMILHIVNNLGKWGKGFVLALAKKYPVTKEVYLSSAANGYKIGDVQFIEVNKNDKIFVANMVAQDGIKTSYKDNKRYVSYESLEDCLKTVCDFALCNRLEVQMPMLGAGLGGGDWQVILEIIKKTLAYKKIHCHIIKLN